MDLIKMKNNIVKDSYENTNNIILCKRYYVVLKHLQEFKNKDITEM